MLWWLSHTQRLAQQGDGRGLAARVASPLADFILTARSSYTLLCPTRMSDELGYIPIQRVPS
jgi:hypothetical protein